MKLIISLQPGQPSAVRMLNGTLLGHAECINLQHVDLRPDGTLAGFIKDSYGFETAQTAPHFDPRICGIRYPQMYRPHPHTTTAKYDDGQWRCKAQVPTHAEHATVGQGFVRIGGRVAWAQECVA